MKTFYSAEDIENFAGQGQREISIDENIVLTDLAKQTADMLGVRLTEKPTGASPVAFSPARPQPVARTQVTGRKPKGCQRRPARQPATVSGSVAGPSRPVVDKLVEKIKGINGKNG